MQPPRFVPGLLLVCAVVAGLASCDSEAPGAGENGPTSRVSAQATAGPRVPLLNDALYAEACALSEMPVQTQAQRAGLKRLALDLMARHEGVRYPRGHSAVWGKVYELITLAELRPGETFFGSPYPVPTLLDGTILATTLEEGLQMLGEACSAGR